ncbi:S8 family serine peptidase [Streptomyces griseoviridis]
MGGRSVGRGAALLAAGLVLASLPPRPADAGGGGRPSAPAGVRTPVPDTTATGTVTLVTGDKVTVVGLGGGRRAVTVERPRGATGGVRTETVNGGLSVVPDEARPYLRDGTLDRRLFDVGALLRQGFGDRAAGGLPLIVGWAPGAAVATPRGTERVRTLPSVRGAAVRAGQGRAFWREFVRRDGIRRVWLDGRVRSDLARSNAQIGTPAAWQAGLTGAGVTVAVLDSGYDAAHPDLAGRVAVARGFVAGADDVADRDGHGTHVTSTVGGSGAASGGTERGVAPGATLAVGKVLGDQGAGSESQIIAGMEWAARDVHARIVSMSLGSTAPGDGTGPMDQAVGALTAETGALFVVSAGNAGAPSSIGSPGTADAALTVGAVDSADRPAAFTSAGPRLGDQALKPDLSAPGVDILAARSGLTPGSGPYTTMSGTSMAVPHVAGVAALLAEEHPDWTGRQVKDALMSSSRPLDASAYLLGAGRVSAAGAVAAHLTATGSADLGLHPWARDGDQPVTRTLTYTNTSDSAVELGLTAEGAPDGVVTLADSSLTVPAHATATTTVTGDAGPAPVGASSGRIVASVAGTPVAHTVFGLVKEDERYTLTVRVKDRDGAAAPADLLVQPLAEGVDPRPARVDASGTLRLRLAPGTYGVTSFLDVRGSHGADSLGLGFLAAPEIVLDRDREVTLDARRLREVRAEVPRRTGTRQLVMEYARSGGGSDLSVAVQVAAGYDSVFAAPTEPVTRGRFEYRTVWRLGRPPLEVAGVRDAFAQAGGTVPDGHRRLPLVDVGDGPVTGVAGRAVLARLAPDADPVALARAAQDAGAQALFVTDDAPGRLSAWWGDGSGDRPFPIATVDSADAARLRAARRVDLTGTPDSPYLYDLSEGHQGAVPDRDLTYRPAPGQLATVRTTFHAARPVTGGEFRFSVTDAFPTGLGFMEPVGLPATRTDHVSTGTGQLWHEAVTAGDGTWEQRGGLVGYRAGTRPARHWFRPVWHPWLGSALDRGQARRGDQLRFDTPGFGDSGPDHTGYGDVWSEGSGMRQTTSVLLDGALVARAEGSAVLVRDAPADPHTYRIVTDTVVDAARWGRDCRGHSEWTVRSAATPADRWTVLPLLNLAFDLGTDRTGAVRAGAGLPVALRAEPVPGATGTVDGGTVASGTVDGGTAATGTVDGGRLDVSYDGGTSWRPVALSGRRGVWRGELRVPDTAGSVSLRASAHDDRGGTVTQEIVRAVGVVAR